MNLPAGYMSEFVAKEIGKKLGGFLECDPENLHLLGESSYELECSWMFGIRSNDGCHLAK